jgi:hypothetical protein
MGIGNERAARSDSRLDITVRENRACEPKLVVLCSQVISTQTPNARSKLTSLVASCHALTESNESEPSEETGTPDSPRPATRSASSPMARCSLIAFSEAEFMGAGGVVDCAAPIVSGVVVSSGGG